MAKMRTLGCMRLQNLDSCISRTYAQSTLRLGTKPTPQNGKDIKKAASGKINQIMFHKSRSTLACTSIIFPIGAIIISIFLIAGTGTSTLHHLYLFKINFGGFNDVRANTDTGLPFPHQWSFVGVTGVSRGEFDGENHIRAEGSMSHQIGPDSSLIFQDLDVSQEYWVELVRYHSFRRSTRALFSFLLLTAIYGLFAIFGTFSTKRQGQISMFILNWFWSLCALVAACLTSANAQYVKDYNNIVGTLGIHCSVGGAAIGVSWAMWVCTLVFNLLNTFNYLLTRKQYSHNGPVMAETTPRNTESVPEINSASSYNSRRKEFEVV